MQAFKPTQDLQYNAQHLPRYPVFSIRQHEQGTVIPDISVSAKGLPKSIRYDAKDSTTASANLISAATAAAMNWHFNPVVKNGKPVAGNVRVPVTFAINSL